MPAGSSVTSQGNTLAAAAPPHDVGAGDRSAAVELDQREARARRAGGALQHARAEEVGDERGGGRGSEVAREAPLDHPPAVDHRDLVAEQGRLAEVVRDEQRRHARVAQAPRPSSRPAAARVRGSSAESGSSSSRTSASARAPGRARPAGARRPRGPRAASRRGAAIPKRSSSDSARAPALVARHLGQPVGDVSPGAQMREQRVVLEQVAAAPPLGRQVTRRRRRRSRPRRRPRPGRARGRTSPAIARRSDVLPAPEGPASARQPEATLERRARARSREAGCARQRRARRRAPPPAERASRTRSSAPLTATSTAESASDASKSVPRNSKIASGAVCVTPRKLPANIRVAPNSPSARPQASAAPVASEGSESGTATRAKVRDSAAPRVLDASSSVRIERVERRQSPVAGRTGSRRRRARPPPRRS